MQHEKDLSRMLREMADPLRIEQRRLERRRLVERVLAEQDASSSTPSSTMRPHTRSAPAAVWDYAANKAPGCHTVRACAGDWQLVGGMQRISATRCLMLFLTT